MKKFSSVEEYLEVLGGYRDLTGKVNHSWFYDFQPIINLARYDVNVLSSMLQSVIQGTALTQKQGDLLCKIILKYKRQFANHKIDVTPVENCVWRIPLRSIDYTHKISIQNDVIHVKFPFNTEFIDAIKSFKVNSQGSCLFHHDSKTWRVALTEYNLNWLYTWGKTNNFEITSEVEKLNNLVIEAEQIPYAIELQYNSDKLDITNCPDSMREYIQSNLGGFDHNNLMTLLDYSGVLGYTIESALADVIVQQYGPRTLQLASHKELRVNPEARTVDDDFVSVIAYALQVNRLPVVIYEPDLQNRLLTKFKEHFPDQNILLADSKKIVEIDETIKFIHCTAPIKNMIRIPLLISSAGMVFGGDKQFMVQSAEKIVYVAAEVYNTGNANSKNRKIEKLINGSKTNY